MSEDRILNEDETKELLDKVEENKTKQEETRHKKAAAKRNAEFLASYKRQLKEETELFKLEYERMDFEIRHFYAKRELQEIHKRISEEENMSKNDEAIENLTKVGQTEDSNSEILEPVVENESTVILGEVEETVQ